jgi:AcrR family transcriptional regulator
LPGRSRATPPPEAGARRAAGRPRGFDTDQALEQIIQAFWDQGFAQTSVDSLQERIGIKRSSFYAAFADKEHAWRLALDRYTRTFTEAALRRLGEPGDVAQRLGGFIRFVGAFLAENRGRGCMFLSAASQRLAVTPATRQHMARLERRIFAAVSDCAAEPAGSYVIAVLLGLNAMARASMAAEAIRAAADLAAAAVAPMVAAGTDTR